MKVDLERDLKETINFFNLNYKTKDGFCNELEFRTISNSYVRILEEAIKKIDFPAYDVYTKIKKTIDSEINNTTSNFKYNLNVSFDKIY